MSIIIRIETTLFMDLRLPQACLLDIDVEHLTARHFMTCYYTVGVDREIKVSILLYTIMLVFIMHNTVVLISCTQCTSDAS